MNRKKIAIISQRYGLEVNGGAETLARVWAEKLNAVYHVDVLTTCAIEYTTWANEYKTGIDYLNGVTVRRFPVDRERDVQSQRAYEAILFRKPRQVFSLLDEVSFMAAQGPASPALINYLIMNADRYDLFIFVTYLYYTTVVGLPMVAEKSALIPAAHDEVPFFMDSIRALMNLPRLIFYNTVEERDFVHRTCGNGRIPSAVVGMGVEVPDPGTLPGFARETGIQARYAIYAGRIDEGKGCPELFDFWIRFKDRNKALMDVKLVLIGKAFIDIPDRPDIVALGFVSEELKYAAIREAELMIMPSHQESFSIVILESMLYGRPVLVNGRSDVLKGHIDRSGGGHAYMGFDDFERHLRSMLTDEPARSREGQLGLQYAERNYRWPALMKLIVENIDGTVERIAAEGAERAAAADTGRETARMPDPAPESARVLRCGQNPGGTDLNETDTDI